MATRFRRVVFVVALLAGLCFPADPVTAEARPAATAAQTGKKSRLQQKQKPDFKIAPLPPAQSAAPRCAAAYADDLSVMKPENRAFESSPEATYTYCVRNTAVYESAYFGKGGKLRKRYITHVMHGTGFAYKTQNGEWYLATNQHVSDHPDVTENDDDVMGVPAGSRKLRETLRIVRNESDDFEPGQIALSKVASDAAMDAAILKTRTPLKLMPYKIGRAAALKVGDVVQVRGYPLGAFSASNTGRVVSLNQPDIEKHWNHTDFVIDALVNSGNSGSPVFAVSCASGELELVGLFHAGYRNAQGLNVVVMVDQLRDFLATHKPSVSESSLARDENQPRHQLLSEMMDGAGPWLLPFGDQFIRLELEPDGLVRFSLLAAAYPLSARVEWALVGRADDDDKPGYLLLPERFGKNRLSLLTLDPTLLEPLDRLWDSIWRQLASVHHFQRLESRQAPETTNTLAYLTQTIHNRKAEQRNILQALDFDADTLAWPAQSQSAPISVPTNAEPSPNPVPVAAPPLPENAAPPAAPPASPSTP